MVQRKMRFVLEERNTLTLRDEDGKCIQTQENIVPEGHSLLLYSEDFSYITYSPSGFHYKRYDPESLSIEEEYTKLTGFSEDKYQDSFALASYSPKTRKAFFITISKTTRELWVYENDSSEPKKVNGKLPSTLWSKSIEFKKEVSFISSYFGESNMKYTVFLCGEDCNGYWTFAIDIPINRSEAPALVTLDLNEKIKNIQLHSDSSFGEGINPSIISCGMGGYMKISTPVDDGSMESKSDSLLLYTLKYPVSRAFLSITISLVLLAILISLFFSILPQSWVDGYIAMLCEGGSYPDCKDDVTGAKYLTAFLISLPILFASLLSRTFQKRVSLWLGTNIYINIRRASKVYKHKVRKIGSVLDLYQTSSETIALLQTDKIQLYNFQRNEIVKTIQGDFENHRILKQRFSFSTDYVEGNKIEECKFLVLHTEINGTFTMKVCDLVSNEILPRQEFHINKKSPGSLRAALIEYEYDAFQPFQLNSRVEIDHTTNPIRLIIKHGGVQSGVADFYNRLHNSPQVWSDIKQISNLTHFIDNRDNEDEVVFNICKKKTLIQLPQYFDCFSEKGEGTHEEDGRLRLTKGDKELAPSLETAIFLEGSNLNSPVTVFKSTFSHNFPHLMKMFWVGDVDKDIHRRRERFKFEDDLPAMSFIHNKLTKFAECSPKQNTKMWENWRDYLPSEELAEVLKIIEKNIQWPREAHAHQMMHGDLTPANIVLNAGEEISVGEYSYDLFLCDFPDLVARDENRKPIYRTETVDGKCRVSSHFFETVEAPRINPMLDLSRFLAHLLLKIPFEPSRREIGGLAQIKRDRRNHARNSREGDLHHSVRKQLESALTWSEEMLREDCLLAEEGTKDDSWRELLKSMIFDQCLQIMMFWRSYRSGAAIENDLTTGDLCWIFYNVSAPQPVYSPTFLEKADYMMRRDHVYPKSRGQTKIHHSSGSFYDWAKNLLDVYNEQHYLEHDVVENQLNSPFYRLVFTQTAKDSLDNYTEKIYDPLKKWVSNPDLLGQSSKLEFNVWGPIQLYKSKLDQSSRVFFAMYEYEDEINLHVIDFYIDDD